MTTKPDNREQTPRWLHRHADRGAQAAKRAVAERDVAAVTDLVTARYHTDLGREVTVHTATMSSTLVSGLDPATGARVVWRHVAKSAAR